MTMAHPYICFGFACQERTPARNFNDIRPAFAPGNRRGGIRRGKGLARPSTRVWDTAAVDPELKPPSVEGSVWSMVLGT